MLVQFIEVGIDAAPFALEEALHGVGKGRVRQPVGGPGLLRQEAARHLVLALGAPFEGGDAVGDAEFQRLVVGRLEMQTGHVLERAPVAAIQGVLCMDHQRGGNGPAFAFGDHQ